MVRENFNRLMGAVRKSNGKMMGSLFKDTFEGSFIPMWTEFVDGSQIEKFDIASALGMFFAIKDANEIELCRRAAALSNKILKNSFVMKLEKILQKEEAV